MTNGVRLRIPPAEDGRRFLLYEQIMIFVPVEQTRTPGLI